MHTYLCTTVVSGQECTNTVGSLNHDSNIVTQSQTFILAGYTVPCNRIVVAWEFCYQILGVTSVTFYPGIWRVTGTRDYALVQSNSITYDASIRTSGASNDQCQRVNLSVTNQFTAPVGSVVGLYSNVGTQLLHTNTDSSITTYQFSGSQSNITNAGNNEDVNYNIAIRVHLGKCSRCNCMCIYSIENVLCVHVVCVCVCVCMCVCVCVRVRVRVCACVCTCTCMYMCAHVWYVSTIPKRFMYMRCCPINCE